jgi:hypothetical protein
LRLLQLDREQVGELRRKDLGKILGHGWPAMLE